MFGLKAIKCDALERRSISLGAQFPQKQTIVTFRLHFPRTLSPATGFYAQRPMLTRL